MEHHAVETILYPAVVIGLVHAIVFTQSAIDKITDFSGNLGWLNDHFGQSIFKGMVKPLLSVLTIMELASGITALVAVALLLFGDHGWMVYGYAMIIGNISYLSLLLGQRIAKDYAGAASLIPYVIIGVMGMFLAGMALHG